MFLLKFELRCQFSKNLTFRVRCVHKKNFVLQWSPSIRTDVQKYFGPLKTLINLYALPDMKYFVPRPYLSDLIGGVTGGEVARN